MKIIGVVLLGLLYGQVSAQVQVQIIDQDMPNPEGRYQIDRTRKNVNVALPDKTKRDKFFKRFPASEAQMKSWDELDRDFFFNDLKTKSFEDVQKKYVTFDKALLEKMYKGAKK